MISTAVGSKFTITYNFIASPMGQNDLVFVNFVNSAGEVVFQDNHAPPVSTAAWSGQVSYSETVTVPTSIHSGSYQIVAGIYQQIGTSIVDQVLTAGGGVTEVGEVGNYLVGWLAVAPSSVPLPGNPCPYAGDNGCADSNATISDPGFEDTTFALDSAQGGQLPQSPTSAEVAARNALLHKNNFNIPYVDYPIGSQAVPPISVASYSNSICQYSATGATGGNGPALICQPTASDQNVTIRDVDFTNLDGTTGSGCAELVIKNLPTAGQIGATITLINDYFEASGSCWAGTSGSNFGLINLPAGTGTALQSLNLINVTIDGNYKKSRGGIVGQFVGSISNNVLTTSTTVALKPGDPIGGLGVAAATVVVSGSGTTWIVSGPSSQTVALEPLVVADGRLNAILDNRTGSTLPFQFPTSVKYSVMRDLGHDPIVGGNGGGSPTQPFNIQYSAFLDFCQNGEQMCHGEVSEMTAANTTRSVNYQGNLVYWPASASNIEMNSAFYVSSGAANNTSFDSISILNNVLVLNPTRCTNSGPYGVQNPCLGQSYGSGEMLNINYDTSINNLTINGNVIDTGFGPGKAFCYANEHNVYSGIVATFSGSTLDVTTPETGFNNAPYETTGEFFVGQRLVDGNASDGWPRDGVVITGFGTYTNLGTIENTSKCLPGVDAGCGTIQVSPAQATPLNPTWYTYADVKSGNYGDNNWSIGGSYTLGARQIPFGNQPWGNIFCP